MEIRIGTTTEIRDALEIARSLPDWFNSCAIKHMEIDFLHNNLIVARENDITQGFLCYTSYSGKWLILWMGVSPKTRRHGIGKILIDWLEEKGREIDIYSIEVETLSDKDFYKPYEETRAFYYKNGFTKTLQKPATISGFDNMMLLEKKLNT